MGSIISQAIYPPFIFSLIIGVPSLILYVIEVFVLIMHQSNFRSAFFRLFIVRFITNFYNYFCSYFYMRLGRIGLFIGFFKVMPSQLLAFAFFFNYYTFHADNLSTMFILLNRLTLIVFPLGHKKVWTYLLPASILITYVAPLACTVQVLSYDYFVRLQNDNWTFTVAIDFKPDRTYMASAYVAAYSALLFTAICGFLNIVTLIMYRRSRSSQANLTTAKLVEQQVESRLTVYAIITFLSQLSMAVFYILVYVASWLFRSDFNFFLSLANQLCWVHDLSTIVLPAWSLLWASSKVRDHVYSIVLPRSWRRENSSLFTERRSVQTSKGSKVSKVGTNTITRH